jgi:hypothetical protein
MTSQPSLTTIELQIKKILAGAIDFPMTQMHERAQALIDIELVLS